MSSRVLPLRRLVLATAAAAACLVAVPAGASASSYCSPTGDYCMEAGKSGGVYRIGLQTFSFRGRVRTCVTGPNGDRTCRRFRLRETKAGLFGFRVRWSRFFPDEGHGRYRVRFSQQGYRIGRTLHFDR